MKKSPLLFILAGAICVPLVMLAVLVFLPWASDKTGLGYQALEGWLFGGQVYRRALVIGIPVGVITGLLLYFLMRELGDE
jgi:hypothetical protein